MLIALAKVTQRVSDRRARRLSVSQGFVLASSSILSWHRMPWISVDPVTLLRNSSCHFLWTQSYFPTSPHSSRHQVLSSWVCGLWRVILKLMCRRINCGVYCGFRGRTHRNFYFLSLQWSRGNCTFKWLSQIMLKQLVCRLHLDKLSWAYGDVDRSGVDSLLLSLGEDDRV